MVIVVNTESSLLGHHCSSEVLRSIKTVFKKVLEETMDECRVSLSHSKYGVEVSNCECGLKEVLMLFRVYRADIVLTSAPAKERSHKQRTTDTMTTHRLIARTMTGYCCKAILVRMIVGSPC